MQLLHLTRYDVFNVNYNMNDRFSEINKTIFFYLELNNSSDNVDKVNESIFHHVLIVVHQLRSLNLQRFMSAVCMFPASRIYVIHKATTNRTATNACLE